MPLCPRCRPNSSPSCVEERRTDIVSFRGRQIPRSDIKSCLVKLKEERMSVSGEKTKKTKRGRTFSVPPVYVILFVFSGIGAVLTHFLPAGRYERVPGPDGRTVIDPDSFEYVQSTPVGLVDFMTAIPRGLIDASEVVFFTFIIGGAFMVLRESGIIESGVNRLSKAFANRGALIIPVLMTVFAAIATIIGTQELSLVYVPVILPLM